MAGEDFTEAITMTPSPAEYQEAAEWITVVRQEARRKWQESKHPRQQEAPTKGQSPRGKEVEKDER